MTIRTPEIRPFPDARKLAATLAAHIAGLLSEALRLRGRASMVVSGGSTPVPLFEELSRAPLAWEQTCITLADERWIDPSEHDSNERLVREHLLRRRAAGAHFIGLMTNAATAAAGEAETAQRLDQLPRPFDLLILGMGADGHIASLFPGALELPAALDLHSGKSCMALTPAAAPHARMTLTLPALLESRQIILQLVGKTKLTVLERALSDGLVEEMPVRAILRQKAVPVTVWWAP